jgi:hypothetical protein
MTPRLPLIAAGVAALLAIPAYGALGDLAAARAARNAARIDAGATIPPLATADARARLGAQVRADAARGGVLIEALAPDPAAPAPLTLLTLRASGTEKAVVAFADTLERAHPPIRMRAWRLTSAPGGVRLDATLVAPWRG